MRAKFFPGAALAALVLCAAAAQNLSAQALKPPGAKIPARSPDGRLVFRMLDDRESEAEKRDPGYALAVVDTKTGRRIFVLPENFVATSHVEEVRVVWSKDSTRFAINYVAGGGYQATSLFRRDGKTFSEMPGPEEVLRAYPSKEKLRQLREQGLPENSYQRRILDASFTRRWIDDETVEADAYSLASVTFKTREGEDRTDVDGYFRIVAKLDPKSGKWEVLKSVKRPSPEM